MKLLRYLLFPFSIIYYLITSFRNFLYDCQFLKSHSFSTPIITVGNLSVGGTGKTPQIEYLITLLKDSHKVAVLSRGYKRKSKGFLLINKENKVDEVGDEPMQYFKKFKNISVAVDENRARGIQKLLKKTSPDVILLDDAFQHRKVNSGYSILLTKHNDLFVNDFLLPVGNLRESRAGAERANCIIVTKCPKNISTEERENIKFKLKKYNKDVFFTSIFYGDKVLGEKEILIKNLKEYKVLLVTGIANPKPLLGFLANEKVKFEHLKFPDHHFFSDSDLENIKIKFEQIKFERKIILTTEKDYVRLYKTLKVYYLPIKTTFLEKETVFNDGILSHISKK